MLGFEGISIEVQKAELLQPNLGFKGTSIEFTQKQYFEPKNGFKSLAIEFDIGGGAQKIWHKV